MIGPLILIGLGVMFLLNNLGMLSLDFMAQWWPVVLIALGVGMLIQKRS